MKTRKQILVASFIAISLMTSLTAQAGFLDWFRSDDAQANVASTGSFDSLYASVMSEPSAENDKPTLVANAVAPANSPVGGVQKALRRTYYVTVSGYNSEVAQTDDSPFITANGTHVRWGIVAANIIDSNGYNIPFNTAIKIPSLFGDQIFIVTDRLNKRYTKNVDVWFEHKADALKLGRRLVQIEVIQ
jgi:3D (Asp-Asp-Asp) domain-containing protein